MLSWLSWQLPGDVDVDPDFFRLRMAAAGFALTLRSRMFLRARLVEMLLREAGIPA
jgi:hypothetical protein